MAAFFFLRVTFLMALIPTAFSGSSEGERMIGRNGIENCTQTQKPDIEQVIEDQVAAMAEATCVFKADYRKWKEASAHSNYTTSVKRYLLNAAQIWTSVYVLAKERLKFALDVEIERKVALEKRDSFYEKIDSLESSIISKTSDAKKYSTSFDNLLFHNPVLLSSGLISNLTQALAARFEMMTQMAFNVSQSIEDSLKKSV